MKDYRYKVTYLHHLMGCAFVRIADDAILYAGSNEARVIDYANSFCSEHNETFYIE